MKIMKRDSILVFLALLSVQEVTTSCSDWLEVDSSANVMEGVLFNDPEGYRTAVNGVYRLLAEPELYGRGLTWGVASVLGNNYDASRFPAGSATNPVSYREMATGDYTSAYSTYLIDPIWEHGYRVIANCNNVIAYTEKQDSSFFVNGSLEKNLILGEMLGVRALVHFDLLRLFTPATRVDDGRLYMPYVTTFPDRQPEHLTVSATLERIIADLEQARSLLSRYDTVVVTSSTYQNRFQTNYSSTYGTFFLTRGTRFNYFAATGILARAYQWRAGNGDMERAYHAARNVYGFSTNRTWFSFTPASNLAVTENNVFRKMPHDILFAPFNNNLYTIVAAGAGYSSTSFFYKNDEFLFEMDLDDFRLYLINTDKTSRRWSMPTGNQNGSPTNTIIQYQGPLAPVVRLSEMIYIMCEYLAEVDLPRAITLLTSVRTARGAKRSLGSPSKETFLQELRLEMTREFMSEGQTFFLYKRLNLPIYNGLGYMDMTGRYVLPIPHSESAYINL
jgi:hypothetical protein